LIFSKDPTKHAQHLTIVLETLRKNGYFARLHKCSFGETTVEFLGHVISYNTISMDKEKLQGVQDWPRPTTTKQVCGFLGLAGYYRRFIQDFATMAAPLHNLTQHDKIKTTEHWDETCTTAFAAIKTAMTSAPVLALPDITKPFVVYTDASEIAIGAVLLQQGEDQALRPVCYLSRKHPDVVTRYAVWEQELFALVTALREWRCYLEGTTSTVYTDHKSLTTLMTQKKLNSRQANWLEEIWCYHHNIVYRRGEVNLADPFSRRPDHELETPILAPMLLAQNGVDDVTMELIKTAYRQDPFYVDLSHAKIKKLQFENGIYYKKS
jgi:hypothetical protein